jgi:hypothetical protein
MAHTKKSRRQFIQTTAAAMGSVALPRLASSGSVPILGPKPKVAAIDYRSDDATFTNPDVVALHARHAYSILGMAPQKSTTTGYEFCRQVKQANPNIKIGQYTILSQAYDTTGSLAMITQAINAGDGAGHDWWARTALNSPVAPGQRTMPQGYEGYSAWSVNQTRFVPANGTQRWPQKCAECYHTLTLKPLWDGHLLDFVFNDNVWWHPYKESDGAQPTPNKLPGDACADYKLVGSNNSPTDTELGIAWRQAYVDYWAALGAKMPGVKVCANADNDPVTYVSCLSNAEFTNNPDNRPDFAFIEALSGRSWSVASFSTMANVMKRYRSQQQFVKTTVFVNSYVDTQTDTRNRTLQKARFGLALAMLDNGHACIADSPPNKPLQPYWFDEMDVRIGLPSDTNGPTGPLSNGMWMRRYANGCVVLNPVDNGGLYMGQTGMTLERRSGVVTLTRPAGVPQRRVGEKIRIQDCTDPAFNGVFTLSAVSATTLQWSQALPDASLSAGGKPALKGYFETMTTLDLRGQGYRHILGAPGDYGDYVDGGTSQNNGQAVGWLVLWSNDAVMLVLS